MADIRSRVNAIAPDDAYTIVCPYCFNRASGGDGTPIPHTHVEFRSETAFSGMHEIEQKLGLRKWDIEVMDDATQRAEATRRFDAYERFLCKPDPKYQAFWDDFGGQTTETVPKSGGFQNPWELPILRMGDGIDHLVADCDGFVTKGVDIHGKETHHRVCPYCHNPFPLGYGKNPVKYISIIGITGSGKTVYISQLLKGMQDYVVKVGLNAYFTSDHESNFIANNPVREGYPLPDSTTPERLSQPMFYDIERTENGKQVTDTIVLYDIAGENCSQATQMLQFGRFVEHSDGIILLVDPKQLQFVSDEASADDVEAPSLALTTLHSVLETRAGEKSAIPMAVCVSKSDRCFDILPDIARRDVESAGDDLSGLPLTEFDGRSFNELTKGEHGLTDLMRRNAQTVCKNLQSGYLNFNFFAVSATGCACVKSDQGYSTPCARPTPKRIEEPILWLFRQFGFIKSNARIERPFPIPQPERYVYKKPLFGKPYLIKQPVDFAKFEEDTVRRHRLVQRRDTWEIMTEEDAKLPVREGGE